MFSLARAFPGAQLHGVTVSTRQVALARELAHSQGLHDRCSFIAGNFEELRTDLRADAIIAVESFAHASRAERFFATCREHLGPGGVVLIVDDFLAHPLPRGSESMQRTIERFRQHWRVPGVCTMEAFDAAAEAGGFTRVDTQDLSLLIRTGRPRDRLVALVSPVARLLGLARRPFWANVVGGHALNRAIRSGWIHYRMLTLGRRVEDQGSCSAAATSPAPIAA
jgi:SAM-dependent methyltransferase